MDIKAIDSASDAATEMRAVLARLDAATRTYFRSRPVVTVCTNANDPGGPSEIGVNVSELLVLGMIARCPVLFLGETGTGKTTLCDLVFNGILGHQNYGTINLTDAVTKDALADPDFARMQTGTLSESLLPASFLQREGLRVEEVGRTHAALVGPLLAIAQGKTIDVGPVQFPPAGISYTFEGEERRFLAVAATGNPDEGFAGTFAIDRALLQRFPIVLDLSDVGQTAHDRSRALLEADSRHAPMPTYDSMIRKVLALAELIGQIPYSSAAKLVLVYLGGRGSCARTKTGERLADSHRQQALCSECAIAKKDVLCKAVKGLSLDHMYRVRSLAAAIALLRFARTQMAPSEKPGTFSRFLGRNIAANPPVCEVTIGDVRAAHSLVAIRHLQIDREFAQSEGYENALDAAATVTDRLIQRFQYLADANTPLLAELAEDGPLTPVAETALQELLTVENPAFMDVCSAVRTSPLTDDYRPQRAAMAGQ